MIAIIGGGASGCALITALAHTNSKTAVTIFNPSDLGPGAAYAPQSASLLMNGPVRAMSIVEADKQHLKRWLVDEDDNTLICRARYGAYLRSTSAASLASYEGFSHVRRAIVDIERDGNDFVLTDDGGERHRATAVVLAMGNFAPNDSFIPKAILEFDGYAGDPWTMDISQFDDRDAILIGSRLTAMDTIALLDERAFRGKAHIISRHGMLACLEDPRVDGLDPEALALDVSTPYKLLRSLRRAARETDADWRAIVESIRSLIPSIWAGWSLRERRRFLRHAQSAWAVHRYRVPPATYAAFKRLYDEGRIILHRGRIVDGRSDGDSVVLDIHTEGTMTAIRVAHVINCTGPNGDVASNRDPLVVTALERGFIRADALRLGIDADERFRVVGADGTVIDKLYAMGPLLRGVWYETTGIPEIASHANKIVRALVG